MRTTPPTFASGVLISKTFSFFIFFIVLLLTKGTTYQGETFLFIEKKEKSSPNLQDGAKKIILNAAGFKQANDDTLRGFLEYLKTERITTEFTRRLENMVQAVRSNEQARQEYQWVSGHIMDARDSGFAQGSRQKALETARLMKQANCEAAFIEKMTGLSKEDVEAIK